MTATRRVRLDWITREVRNTVVPEALGSDLVFHYSIPVIDETGDGRLERTAELGSSKTMLAGGEVLISKLNPRKARVLVAESHDVPTLASGEFVALQPTDVHQRFLYWLLTSEAIRQRLDAAVQSATRSQQRVRPEEVTKMWVDVPVHREQRAIAGYLDTESARIDGLVEQYRRLVELQLERRLAITMQGVEGQFIATDRQASGLTYLQTVPKHWDEVSLSLLAKLGSGHTPSREHAEWWVDATIPWITTGEVWQLRDDRVEYVSETRENVSELGIANSAAELHPAGTVFLSRTASAGFSGIMARDMATSQDFVTWTCGPRIRPRFLLLCLRAMRGDLLGRLAMGSTHKTIYFPDIQSIKVPLPPIEEQDQIVDWVWNRLRAIDAVVDAIERQVSFLMERRQALITATVTGQQDISGVAA